MAKRERKTIDRNVILREHYRMLREAGFSPAEATRFRGASREKILEAIRTGKLPPLEEKKAVRRGKKTGWRKFVETLPEIRKPKPWKGRLDKLGDYTVVQKGLTKVYNAKFSYVVWYVTRDKDGNYHDKYLIYQSDQMITSREELFKKIRENIFEDEENESEYEAQVIMSSLTVTGAFYNPEFD